MIYKLKIIILLILIILLVYLLYNFSYNNVENMINIDKINNVKWTRNNCSYNMNDTIIKVLNKNNINNSKQDGQLYFPCSYDDIEEEINKIKIHKSNNQRFFIINNADLLIGKNYLWKHIMDYHGLDIAKTLMPMTYILDNEHDRNNLRHNFDKTKLYILKKNIQRQEGLKITNSLDEILNAYKQEYVIVQELLQNPYLIKGRKINMRFYILVICKNQNIDVYVFNNGFMYYTKELFKKNSMEIGPNITTGYVDRWIYDVHPLTHIDFKNYLDNNSREFSEYEKYLKSQNKVSDYVFNKIYLLINKIFQSFIGKICGGKLSDYITFQLFGADIAIDNKLNPMLMEINKGPDMGAKDKKDGEVKYKCMLDVLDKIGVINIKNHKNGFIKILDYEKQ